MAAARRLRTYLTPDEVARLLCAAKKSRHGARNHAMVLIAYRHGLRASEVVGLRWSDVDLERGTIYCRRAKGSRSTVHPLKHDEIAALGRLRRPNMRRAGEYVFASERGERMSRSAFWRVVAQTGGRAGLPVKAYAHLLRHYAESGTMPSEIAWTVATASRISVPRGVSAVSARHSLLRYSALRKAISWSSGR